MALSKRAKEMTEQGFSSIFPDAKIKVTNEAADGGAESVKISIPEIDKTQFKALWVLLNKIPNFFYIRRSGAGLTLIFS